MYIYIYTYTCIHIYIYICMYVCMYVCMYKTSPELSASEQPWFSRSRTPPAPQPVLPAHGDDDVTEACCRHWGRAGSRGWSQPTSMEPLKPFAKHRKFAIEPGRNSWYLAMNIAIFHSKFLCFPEGSTILGASTNLWWKLWGPSWVGLVQLELNLGLNYEVAWINKPSMCI